MCPLEIGLQRRSRRATGPPEEEFLASQLWLCEGERVPESQISSPPTPPYRSRVPENRLHNCRRGGRASPWSDSIWLIPGGIGPILNAARLSRKEIAAGWGFDVTKRSGRYFAMTLGLTIVGSATLGSAQSSTVGDRMSFTFLYEQVLSPAGCAAAFCHGIDAPAGGLSLSSRERAHEALVGVPAMGVACVERGFLRVAPGEPDASLLLMKLAKRPPCGMAMPAPEALLSDSHIAAIRRWIEAGAPNN